jgi:hypothetical protein
MVFIHKSGVRFSVGAPRAPVAQLDRVSVFETEGYKFKSYQVHHISSRMKYLFLFLLLISCSVKDCRVNPNAIIETKTETKTDSKTTDTKTDSKSIIDQVRDLRDNLKPGAQLRCGF